MKTDSYQAMRPTCFVYRAIQRDKPWDRFLGPFAPKHRRGSFLNRRPSPSTPHHHLTSEAAFSHADDNKDVGPDSATQRDWDTASIAASVSSEWLTSDDSEGESAYAFEDDEVDYGLFPQPNHGSFFLLRAYNANGNLTGQDHILSRWEPHTNSPWISLTLSLEYGVFYQAMTTFISTDTRTNLACQANPRDLYAMEVPRDELYKFEIPSHFDDVQLDETMAENFSRIARERLAARELTVYRFEPVRIPDQVEAIAYGWFAARAANGVWSFPFRQWRQFMYDECPDWFDLIVDPVAKWELEREDDWTEDRLNLALQ